jgi:uncharacterized delta-60 repeat protein
LTAIFFSNFPLLFLRKICFYHTNKKGEFSMQKIIVTTITYFLFFFTMLAASPSSLDTSFNNNGSASAFISYTINQSQAIIAQPDGKIITAGYAGDNAIITRFNNNGSLDAKFNSNDQRPGTVVVNLGFQSAAYALALQPDGKIIIAGFATDSNNTDNALIQRYHPDGSIDTSFNTTGTITNNFFGQAQLYGVALQPDGNIVVTGWAINNGLSYALVARYNSDGTPDTTFNSTGYITTLIGGVFTKARAIQIQDDGKIVIAGQAQIDDNQQIVVIRYAANGTLDTTFNVTSATSTLLGDCLTSAAFGMALQDDQKIIVTGSTNPYDTGFNNKNYTIIRLDTNLDLDETFNADDTPGYIISDIGLQANDAVVQSNGQIVTCGFNYSNNHIVIVIRYNNDGTIDPTFNFVIDNIGSNTIANALALQFDGKIIVSGTVGTHYTAS